MAVPEKCILLVTSFSGICRVLQSRMYFKPSMATPRIMVCPIMYKYHHCETCSWLWRNRTNRSHPWISWKDGRLTWLYYLVELSYWETLGHLHMNHQNGREGYLTNGCTNSQHAGCDLSLIWPQCPCFLSLFSSAYQRFGTVTGRTVATNWISCSSSLTSWGREVKKLSANSL